MTNLVTDEELIVVRVQGDELWLRNEAGEIEHALREHLPAERWRLNNINRQRVAVVFEFPALFQFKPKARSAP
ncbi:hypothetical protein [Pseudomonas sp. TWP3-2]|uniref:hypothetical protein n=1 Tax=Pseudomonas sp. TWP3-2 TaxID=2804574 RepID=UPI003CF82C8D